MKKNERAQLELMSQLLYHHPDMAHVWTKMLYDETDSAELVELAKSLWSIVGPQTCDAEWLQSTMVAWRNSRFAPAAVMLSAFMTAPPGPTEPPQTAIGALDPQPQFRALSGVWKAKNACVITGVEEHSAILHVRNDAGSRPHQLMTSRWAYDGIGRFESESGIGRRSIAVNDPVWVYMDAQCYPTIVTPRKVK